MKSICNNPFLRYQFKPNSGYLTDQFSIQVKQDNGAFRVIGFNDEVTMLEHFAFLLLSLGMSQSDVEELQYDEYGQVRVNIKGMEIVAECLPF